MKDKDTQRNEEIEIDLGKLFQAVLRRTWLVAIAAAVGAVAALLVTVFAIPIKYESSAMFYVNNSSISVGNTSLSISSADLTTSRNLVESYIVILNTRESLNDVIDYAGVDLTYAELKKMISAEAVNETEIFEVVVTGIDPVETEKIANAIAYILPKRISSIIEGSSAKVVDAAVIATSPSSPSRTKNTIVGFLLGAVLSVGVIVLQEIFDVTIRTEEDIAQSCRYPVLAEVPDMLAPVKGGHEYRYERKKHSEKKPAAAGKAGLIGGGVSFAAAESYKLLRTKLQFSFADENGCRVIGLSSAMSNEGKSLTAINLAYALSELGKKVMLIDCDMRRPTLAEKLNIQKAPGFSSFLTGQCGIESIVQHCGIKHDEKAFHVIAAGQNPPNPVELLSSARMERVISSLRKVYDYVILDLPPIGAVSDALAVAKETDGMLLVVRQNVCSRMELSEAVRQFEFVDAKILGVVFNGTSEHGSKYYHTKYYKSDYSVKRSSGSPGADASDVYGR